MAVARAQVDRRLNGLLVNWYDASLGHYIGQHRDKTRTLVKGTPIVTASFGDPRVFRLRPYRRDTDGHDLLMTPGTVILIPWETNETWTHGVPKPSGQGRRVSITIRAFQD